MNGAVGGKEGTVRRRHEVPRRKRKNSTAAKTLKRQSYSKLGGGGFPYWGGKEAKQV